MPKIARIAVAVSVFAVAFAGVGWLGLFVAEKAGLELRIPFLEPDPGGAFALVDHNGQPFTEANLQGQPSLIYFGYTYCPDICPTHLADLMTALDLMGDDGKAIRPIFVSIDPARDTVEQVAGYAAHFSERMVGLTGTPEQVKTAAKAFGVYYRKVAAAGDDAYQMDHSALGYLMAMDGGFLTTVPPGIPPQEMADKMRKFLNTPGGA